MDEIIKDWQMLKRKKEKKGQGEIKYLVNLSSELQFYIQALHP